jgi:transcriptional regulator with XRE-family HTH domain
MTLDEYLSTQRITEAQFAALIERSQAQVNRIRRGKSWPSKRVLARISEVTNGTVTANDFASLEAAG